MRIPECHIFLLPGWISFSYSICVSICDFTASFSCSSSEVEGNISSNHRRVVVPNTGCGSEAELGALRSTFLRLSPGDGCVSPGDVSAPGVSQPWGWISEPWGGAARLPGRNAPRKPGSRERDKDRDKDRREKGTAKRHGLQRRRRRKASQEEARTGTCLQARSIGGSNPPGVLMWCLGTKVLGKNPKPK